MLDLKTIEKINSFQQHNSGSDEDTIMRDLVAQVTCNNNDMYIIAVWLKLYKLDLFI
jgi:hypothetical protein